MKETLGVGPIEEMRGKLLHWLADPNAKSATLLDWLEGFDLPSVARDDDKFLWLVRALPSDGDREQVRRALAERIAKILSALRNSPWNRRPRVLAELLLLAANLRRPTELANPLWVILENLRSTFTFAPPWNEEVRDALRCALAENQSDNRLMTVWETMVCGGTDPVLPGDRYVGWRWLSRCVDDAGSPNMAAIGLGLKAMVSYLTSDRERRVRFRELIAEAERYHHKSDFVQKLVDQADKDDWPKWAVECFIPYLEIPPTGRPPQESVTALVWSKILHSLPADSFVVRRRFCSDEMVEVQIPRQHIEHARAMLRPLSVELSRNPFGSPRSAMGVANDVLEEFEERLKRPQVASLDPKRIVSPNRDLPRVTSATTTTPISDIVEIDSEGNQGDEEPVYKSRLEALRKFRAGMAAYA